MLENQGQFCLRISTPLSGGQTAILHPRGVVRISSDRDDRTIFLGLNFRFRDFFWVGKFSQVFFWVFKTNVSNFHDISFNAFWKFLWLRNSA